MAWGALIPLYVSLNFSAPRTGGGANRRSWVRSWLIGYTFGFVLFFVGAYWMLEIGSVPWVVLSLIEAAPFAAFAAISAAAFPRLPAAMRPWIFAALWVLLDAARSYGAYAFPWFILATTQARVPILLQIVDATGQWGLTFFIAAVNGLLGQAWLTKSDWRRAAPYTVAAGAILVVLAGYGGRQMVEVTSGDAALPRRTVGIAQGSLDKDAYNDEEGRIRSLRTYLNLTRDAVKAGGGLGDGISSAQSSVAFVVWPETVAPGVFSQDIPMQNAMAMTARGLRTPLLAGVYDIDSQGRCWNSAVLYDRAGGLAGRYDKQQIVPIGEFFPLRGVLGKIYEQYGVPAKDLSSGTTTGTFTVERGEPDALRVGTIICYESVFPRWPRECVRAGASVIVLLTSDATFGTTAGPIQHADIAAVRAVETGRWVVRAASTGVSEFIDPAGRVRASLPLMRQDVLTYPVAVRDNETLYVRWGDWFLWWCCLIVAAGAIIAFRRHWSAAPESAIEPASHP